MIVHEESYKGISPRNLVHKARLKKVINLLTAISANFSPESRGVWADFGCSNGYIINIIQKNIVNSNRWLFHGFDHKKELLELANQRNLSNASFDYFDLNSIDKKYSNRFDVVTCFETLEHTGSYENAFENLYLSCKASGFIVVSVPNEIGVPGIFKYFGRKIRKRNAYGDFFDNQSSLKYVFNTLLGKDIECFRRKDVSGWGPHLGFDYRCFEKFLKDKYINNKKCILYKTSNSFLSFNKIYVIKKLE